MTLRARLNLEALLAGVLHAGGIAPTALGQLVEQIATGDGTALPSRLAVWTWHHAGLRSFVRDLAVRLAPELAEPPPEPPLAEPEPPLDEFAPRPPLGVMPERLWIEKRLDELLAACTRLEHAGREPLAIWRDEICRHQQWLEIYEPEGRS